MGKNKSEDRMQNGSICFLISTPFSTISLSSPPNIRDTSCNIAKVCCLEGEKERKRGKVFQKLH